MSHSFLFVDSTTADSTLRKRIRRHVMTGKNAGKTFHRRSRLDLIREYNSQNTEGLAAGNDEDKPRWITSKEVCPLNNDTNLSNPFRSLSIGWESIGRASDILDEYFSHVLERIYPCRIGISAEDAKRWWLNLAFMDEAAYYCTVAIAHSCNHLLRGGGVGSQKALLYRSRTLSLMRKRLETDFALSNSTLCIIIMLIIEEQIRAGSMETLIHYDGLRKLIDLRGGLSQLECFPALFTNVCKMDILYAFQYGKPILYFQDRMSEAQIRLASKGIIFDRTTAESSSWYLHQRPYLRGILIDATILAKLLDAVPSSGKIDLYAFTDLLHSLCYRLIRYHPLDSVTSLGDVEDVFHIGLTLFVMSLFMQYDQRRILQCDLVFQRYRDVLNRDLFCVDSNIVLWLALIGGMWIVDSSVKIWNASKLKGLATNLGISTWPEVQNLISPFPWIKSIHETPGIETWNTAAFTG